MSLGVTNIICIGIGVVALIYSLIKATHERKYWRKKDGYTLHVTVDVVLYFLTGAFIVLYNVYHILCDYLDAENLQYQIIPRPEMSISNMRATVELKRSTPNSMQIGLDNNGNNAAAPESSC